MKKEVSPANRCFMQPWMNVMVMLAAADQHQGNESFFVQSREIKALKEQSKLAYLMEKAPRLEDCGSLESLIAYYEAAELISHYGIREMRRRHGSLEHEDVGVSKGSLEDTPSEASSPNGHGGVAMEKQDAESVFPTTPGRSPGVGHDIGT